MQLVQRIRPIQGRLGELSRSGHQLLHGLGDGKAILDDDSRLVVLFYPFARPYAGRRRDGFLVDRGRRGFANGRDGRGNKSQQRD